MGRTAVSTQIGFMKTIACADIRADVPKIQCPTLVITTDGSGLASVDETRAWQQQIPNSSLLVLPGNSYHVAASHAVALRRQRHSTSSAGPAAPKPVGNGQRTLRSLTRVAVDGSFRSSRQVGWVKWMTKSPL